MLKEKVPTYKYTVETILESNRYKMLWHNIDWQNKWDHILNRYSGF